MSGQDIYTIAGASPMGFNAPPLMVGHINRSVPVDVMCQVIAAGNDRIVVPLLLLDRRLDFVGITNVTDHVLVTFGVDDDFLAA